MTVSRTSLHRIVTMQTKKLKKLATEFLWANAGDSFGCNGGGGTNCQENAMGKICKKRPRTDNENKKIATSPKNIHYCCEL